MLTLSLFASLNVNASTQKTHILNIQHWKTSNGLPVYFVATSGVPMLDIRMIFRAGSAYDHKNWGLAQLVNNSLNQGTSSLNEHEIAVQLEQVGAQYSTNITHDMATVNLRTLTAKQYLLPAVSIFHKIITDPLFSPDQVNTIKKMSIAEIKHNNQNPATIARNQFFSQVYNHSGYAHPPLGTLKTVTNITAEQLKKFYHRYYVTQNAYLVLVGSVSTQKAHVLAEQLSSHLPQGKPANQLLIPAIKSAQAKDISQINFNSNQTAIYLGSRGITRLSPDYFPLIVGNSILGGSTMTSLLFDKIRNQQGLTYHIRSQNEALQYGGLFYITLSTNQKTALHALEATEKAWLAFCKNGPSEQQIQLAKNYLTRSFPLNFDTNQKIANTLTYIAFYHRSLNFLDQYQKNINNVTRKQIKSIFNHLASRPFFIVTVGHTNA